ncbi:MAG: hypothetical protein LBN39_13465 [Planctomycetaceae bacterium]|nr:hypothetical protein [Planctomycetaceae bacterium]
MLYFIALTVSAGAAENVWQTLYAEKRAAVSTGQVPSLTLPPESCLILGADIAECPLVIEDLNIALNVKSSSAGVALGVLVVLPNVKDPATGQPLMYLVAGSKYSGSGQWETLGFFDKDGKNELKKRVEQLATLLRAEHIQKSYSISGSAAGVAGNWDLNGKYIAKVVLYCESLSNQTEQRMLEVAAVNISGIAKSGGTSSAADTVSSILNLTGFQLTASVKTTFMPGQFNEGTTGYTEWRMENGERFQRTRLIQDNPSVLPAAGYQLPTNSSPASLMQIKLTGSVLSVDDIPIGARVIEYNNEPLAMLRKLEFNAVWVKGTASAQLLQEARDAGVWLICTPPSPAELQRATKYDKSVSELVPADSTSTLVNNYDNVLAWNLGDECSQADHAVFAQWAAVLKNADRIRRRPVICTARSGVYDYSRIADILMMRREPMLSSLEMAQLRTWQTAYQTLARPDTTFWCNIQTQASEKLQNQWAMFEGNPPYICPFSYEQIKLQVYSALASGVHGFVFSSNTPLTNNDPETEFRRTALELINWELQMIEEWFAGGRTSAELAKSNRKPMSSAVIQSGFSRLLVPLWNETQSQSALGPAVAGNLQYTIAGIPETYNAYHLVPGRLYPLDARRVAGGMKIELPEANLNSLIFFGETDAVYAKVGQRAKMLGPRASYLACHLAELELAATEQVLSALKQAKEAGTMPVHPKDNLPLISVPETETQLKSTKDAITFAKELTQRHPPDYARSYLQAETATRGLRLIARNMIQEAVRNDLNPCMTPVSVSFFTLPLYIIAQQRTGGAKLEPVNRLNGGDMENIALMNQAGWETVSHKVDGVAPPLRNTVPAASRTAGKNGLQLIVSPLNPAEKPLTLETVPVWLTTPPIPVRMGEMLCVNGWVRIPQTLESTVDGLMIFDSLGGEPLALRFTGTKGEWREFAFYRIVPADSNYYIFFGLNGFGEAQIDDVRVCAVQFAEPKEPSSMKAAPEQQNPSMMQRLNPFQYLPPLPRWNNP